MAATLTLMRIHMCFDCVGSKWNVRNKKKSHRKVLYHLFCCCVHCISTLKCIECGKRYCCIYSAISNVFSMSRVTRFSIGERKSLNVNIQSFLCSIAIIGKYASYGNFCLNDIFVREMLFNFDQISIC